MTTLRFGLGSIDAQAKQRMRVGRLTEMHAKLDYREICPPRILASLCAVAHEICDLFSFKLAKAMDLPSPTVAPSTRKIDHLFFGLVQLLAHDFALDLREMSAWLLSSICYET